MSQLVKEQELMGSKLILGAGRTFMENTMMLWIRCTWVHFLGETYEAYSWYLFAPRNKSQYLHLSIPYKQKGKIKSLGYLCRTWHKESFYKCGSFFPSSCLPSILWFWVRKSKAAGSRSKPPTSQFGGNNSNNP